MASNNLIYGINGPVVTVKNTKDFSMQEMVYVGNARLVGEIIGITDQFTTIQVYETTTGLRPGEPVFRTGAPMSVTLGPGVLTNIYDGIQRPLKYIESKCGPFIEKGLEITPIDVEKEWDVTVTAKVGDTLAPGQIYATIPETSLIEHRCMVPPALSGKVVSVAKDGKYKVNDTVVTIENEKGEKHELTLCQKWPIRVGRPVKKRIPIDRPLITGQRVIDTMFPIAKGGTAAIPGGFGTGKTMTQHQIAKWCDADIIIYIGCGERRTVLIANTSNMPVAAREASIYTGITLAEYYRDMGYDVAIMADSTSRWAEALREISGRLEEMPAEEGFPAYLPSRLAAFYERAGYMQTLSDKEGSVSIIGAVSPQGGDLSEPVTQNTKRFIRCFWALDKSLAYARHYPAINWIDSYSEYLADLKPWFDQNVGKDFVSYRNEINTILHEENKLMEIVKLIGSDVLPDDQKLVIEIARIIRVGFLQQNAFHAEDTYVPIQKQMLMMGIILHLYRRSKEVVAASIPISKVMQTGLYEKAVKMKYDIPNDKLNLFDDFNKEIDEKFDAVVAGAQAAG